jgi:hypothetical protein
MNQKPRRRAKLVVRDSPWAPVCALLRAGGNDFAPAETVNPVPASECSSAETEQGGSIVGRFENYEVMLDQAWQVDVASAFTDPSPS